MNPNPLFKTSGGGGGGLGGNGDAKPIGENYAR